MRKELLCLSVALVAMAGTAMGAEFQPMGALGIGGAGVARTYDAYAPYWNPAGLAFSDKDFSSRIDASVGLKVNDGLADNVDRLSKIDFKNIKNLDTTGPANPQTVTDTVQAITILNDIKTKNGTLAVNGNAVLGFQIKRFAFGAFGTFEGFAQPNNIDTVRILPESSGSTNAVNPASFAAQVAGQTASHPTLVFFTSRQQADITNALTANGLFTTAQANDIIHATDFQMAQANSGLSSQQVADTLTNTLVPALSSPNNTNTFKKNQTTILTKSLAYLEFPFSYGHPFSLGSFGILGIGATAKVISGRVYQNQTFLFNENTTSKDITKELTKNYKDSTSFGFDVGALWRYSDWLNLGVVAKNLNSPEFDAPDLKDIGGVVQVGSGGKVKLKPQVRMGIALDPYKWLTLATDLDLTENETVMAADNFKNRTVGGGFEWHYFSWFKLRGGMYSNIATNGIGPTATAGLTFGTKWLNMDIDGAYALETAQYKEKSYPQEARVQLQLNCQF